MGQEAQRCALQGPNDASSNARTGEEHCDCVRTDKCGRISADDWAWLEKSFRRASSRNLARLQSLRVVVAFESVSSVSAANVCKESDANAFDDVESGGVKRLCTREIVDGLPEVLDEMVQGLESVVDFALDIAVGPLSREQNKLKDVLFEFCPPDLNNERHQGQYMDCSYGQYVDSDDEEEDNDEDDDGGSSSYEEEEEDEWHTDDERSDDDETDEESKEESEEESDEESEEESTEEENEEESEDEESSRATATTVT